LHRNYFECKNKSSIEGQGGVRSPNRFNAQLGLVNELGLGAGNGEKDKIENEEEIVRKKDEDERRRMEQTNQKVRQRAWGLTSTPASLRSTSTLKHAKKTGLSASACI
jgi:hypothetical protein